MPRFGRGHSYRQAVVNDSAVGFTALRYMMELPSGSIWLHFVGSFTETTRSHGTVHFYRRIYTCFHDPLVLKLWNTANESFIAKNTPHIIRFSD